MGRKETAERRRARQREYYRRSKAQKDHPTVSLTATLIQINPPSTPPMTATKRRGRPLKASTADVIPIAANPTPTAPSSTTAKRRGRPSKASTVIVIPIAANSTPTIPPRRGRGRQPDPFSLAVRTKKPIAMTGAERSHLYRQRVAAKRADEIAAQNATMF